MILEPFFELLRAGLWQRDADTEFFSDGSANWENILALASQQTVLGVVFDGIETLPAELRPPRNVYIRWAAQVALIEEANGYLNELIPEVFSMYESHGLKPVLLKGQGLAMNYPRPEHRQCGDIDIYIGKGNYKAANHILTVMGGVCDSESNKHAHFVYKGMTIENHRIIGHLNAPDANKLYEEFIDKYMPGQTAMVDINGHQVAIPAPDFNAAYIFMHAFHHFLSGGIGLRHVCDWARFIARGNADGNVYMDFLREAGLERAVRAFAYVAVFYVGLDGKRLPFGFTVKDKQAGEKLVKDILLTGNFGQFDVRVSERPKGFLAGKWHTFRRATKRCAQLYTFAPREAAFFPFVLIRNSLGAMFKLNRE